ncbi:T9SS type A sorting domain-containing protein [uncultured Planktosalinus sp.]|uniref:T9SS type A sorting domain-containing protein n=1 Tax=uncultured Planktosalinus sp. TaxID=1810935 RepID=UPI0030DDA4EA
MRASIKYLTLLLLFIPIFTWGQTHIWTGNGGDTDWFNLTNWDTNSVPDADSDVLIPDGFVVEINSANALVGFLILAPNATLEVNNSMTITTGIEILEDGYFLYSLGTLSGDATINNHGTFEITGVPNKVINQLTINNENLLLITDAGIINVRENMSINNAENALVIVNGSGDFSTNATGATFNNFGTFHKMDTGQFGAFYLLLTTNNHGTIRVGKSQNLLILGPQMALNNFETGILTGEGAFDITSPFTNTGIIRPEGDQAVELDFVNTFSLSSQSTIELDFFGNGPEQYDRLEVIDNPFIEGGIDVSLHYEASVNDEFTVITTSHGISGCNLPPSIFSTHQGFLYEFEVTCTLDDVILKVIDKVLTTEEFEPLNLTAIPNPNNGAFEIQFSTPVSEVILTINNILGQTISTHTVRNTDRCQLTIDGSTGIYFIKADTTNRTGTFKVVKK